jgi:hypothetical protein
MSYEPRDVSSRVLWLAAGSMIALVAFALALVIVVYRPTTRGSAEHAAGSFTHGPHSRPDVADYTQAERESEEHLHGYGWVDRKAGVAQIPIERAMELVVSGVKPAPAPEETGKAP